MARKRRKVPKTGSVWHMSTEEATLAKMPRYDAWAGGYGPHGEAGYRRAREKRAWQAQIRQEGARDGLLSFSPACPGARPQTRPPALRLYDSPLPRTV